MAHRPLLRFVIPWFGNANGGAEVYCHGLVTTLAAAGHQVEVLATCCKDPFHDWSTNQLPAGKEDLAPNLTLRRFPVRPRDAGRFAELWRKLDADGGLSSADEAEIVRHSIHSDELAAYLDAHRHDAWTFFLPYLYGTTVEGARRVPRERLFFIPCLHNETMAYITPIRQMMQRARGVLFLSEPERELARALYGLENAATSTIGGGVDVTVSGDSARFRAKFGLGDAPYLLGVGRKVPPKGADLLVRLFGEYRQAYPEDDSLRLVLIGTGELSVSSGLASHVLDLRQTTRDDVMDAMAGCEAFVHPSFVESFSIVMMEAWAQGRPVLVNGECEVTAWHAHRSLGGLSFTSDGEFIEAVRRLRRDPELCLSLGRLGREYVKRHYTWPVVLRLFEEFLNSLDAVNPPAYLVPA